MFSLAEKIVIAVLFSILSKYAGGIGNEIHSQHRSTDMIGVLDQNERPCCEIENRIYHSLDDALSNLTSNSLITLTTDVIIASRVTLKGLHNIAIVGQGNRSINCNGTGAINFAICTNVTIENIDWEKCGSSNESYPGISFYKSSNLTIQRCSFNSSTGQSVVLSEVSGNVHITNSLFTNDSQHSGHGAALHYTPGEVNYTQLVINNCKFSYNGISKSVIYLGSLGNTMHSCLQNSIFIGNRGAPIYLSHHELHVKGDVSFMQNVAIAGGGIYSSNSTILFKNNSKVIFHNNSANTHGGAIFLNGSKICFGETAIISFTNNIAQQSLGGGLFSINSIILFDGNSTVMFQSNMAVLGGAMYHDNCSTSFNDNSTVMFISNRAEAGGAVFSKQFSEILFDGNVTVMFQENEVGLYGGGVYIEENCNVMFDGNSAIAFINNSATYGGAMYLVLYSTLKFSGNTTVTYKENKGIQGGGGAVDSYINCSIKFDGSSKVTFSGNIGKYGGAMLCNAHTGILFDENSEIMFSKNEAFDGGAIYLRNNSRVLFEGNISATLKGNVASETGGALFAHRQCGILFNDHSVVTFSSNAASYGGAVYSVLFSTTSFRHYTSVMFTENQAIVSGGAIYSHEKCYIVFDDNSTVEFIYNRAKNAAIYSYSNSVLLFAGSSDVKFNKNEAIMSGGAVLSASYSNVIFRENSTVAYSGNIAEESGGAVESRVNSSITFDGTSKVTFNKNEALTGGSVFSFSNSLISFVGKSMVIFNSNYASFGGAVHSSGYSKVLHNEMASVTYKENKAFQDGGAISSYGYDSIVFGGNSKVIFTDNTAKFGGAVHSRSYSSISFGGNTTVTYNSNTAGTNGAGIYSHEGSGITFGENSIIIFINNTATFGGAIHSFRYSSMLFDGHTLVTYVGNHASGDGGALNSYVNGSIRFDGHANVTFNGNSATFGGAMYSRSYSNITFDGNVTVTYKDNKADEHGGGVKSRGNSGIVFDGNSMVVFSGNRAKFGGAVCSESYSGILFVESTIVTYEGNQASIGGAGVYSEEKSSILFDGTSMVIFSSNRATLGGAVYSRIFSKILFNGNTTVTYKANDADKTGGAIASIENCNITFTGNSKVTLSSNGAKYGGAVYSEIYSTMLFNRKSKVSFIDNYGFENGGALCFDAKCDIMFNGMAEFIGNMAKDGGAIAMQQSDMKFALSSQVIFHNNSASRTGGGIYLDNNYSITLENKSNVIFNQNNASRHGGAIYGELAQRNHSKILSITPDADFNNNTALIGDDVYVHIQPSCDEMCLNNSVEGLQVTHNYPPLHLALYQPAVCADAVNTSNDCNTYFIKNIMLGQNIKINACVLSFYDKSAVGVDFLVTGESQHHYLDDSQFIPIGCKIFEGISVLGKKVISRNNFSMTITSYTSSETEISIKLLAELSPCHPGYIYDNTTQKCVCYNSNDIVSCSGSSTSAIKRGYWFGVIDGKPTVAICPNNYCNFTCCETTNGFYHLAPVRLNQCSAHRSGTACGNCEEGYTLSFDSQKCVSTNKCTTRQTVLVVALSMVYWVTLVMAVFIVTYYHAEIGYLYAITYYFSVLDILLDQTLYAGKGLHTTVSILSSITKLTPKFLGELCLVKKMIGIDQEFTHYVHAFAVTIIVITICQSTRVSYRLSAFVSRGIIRVICYLLLLSYTSVASTSLLLLRPMTFYNVDKIYTYLSPDTEYFHGRHLPYVIVAIICTLVIVIGLPLLLLLEPFLNHKINFTRIKPLLDQFQGCYKDKYRSFAAYYMICRLLIILIIVINFAINNSTQVLLLITNTLLALIHLIVKPYRSNTLNIFDGMILQMMVFASVISLFDSFGTKMLSAVTILLVVLPLITFAIMELMTHKESIKRIIIIRCKPQLNAIKDQNEVHHMNDVGITIDDNLRKNATIVDM